VSGAPLLWECDRELLVHDQNRRWNQQKCRVISVTDPVLIVKYHQVSGHCQASHCSGSVTMLGWQTAAVCNVNVTTSSCLSAVNAKASSNDRANSVVCGSTV
jgi:hypothetical protein